MAARVYLIFLVALARCRCDHSTAYSSTIGQFGELLRPPPPPHSPIQPVPFHGNPGRSQRQNTDIAYQYQPPPPPPLPTNNPFSSEFKFPAPFYKQYNFNFVPPPQPFTTTPSPSLFQKVSTWLFPSQQTYDAGMDNNNIGPIKKDCNPCNLVPWIPVLRYNLGAKSNQYHSNNPTYGPPSPTALADSATKFQPQPFLQQNVDQKPPQLYPGIPHAVYGPPTSTFNSYSGGGAISSTYGPPSPTHTIPSQNPISSTFIASSSPYSIPSSTYGEPSSSIRQPSSSYLPTYNQGVAVTSYNTPTSTYRTPTHLYTTPVASYQSPFPVSTYGPPVTPFYEPGTLNNDLPPQNDIEILNETGPSEELQLPKVAPPKGFRNSYGELIPNPYSLESPYPVSATAAESTKVKTEVLPNDFSRPPNQSLSLANPAPFTLNRGRNIHTLQPVALPNLSVSPLPPIFNARPFRPVKSSFSSNILTGINQMQQKPNNVDVSQSIPLTEFTHSVDYPTTFIQSPVIDIESLRLNNQTKAYRNIPNHFVIDQIRDISSQASEDHVQSTKTIPEASFESTGGDVGNDIYDTGLPADLNQNSYVPSNHKPNHNFGDLRGYKDEDVDKYRTESNLQNIDSPLLYLKPSAPHKSFGDFILAFSTPINDHDFELYDDVQQSTQSPQPPTITAWDESRNDYAESLSPLPEQSNTYKPKIVQIIVPYTTNKVNNPDYEQESHQWTDILNERHQGRKIPSNTNSPDNIFTENTNAISTTTEEPLPTVTESYDDRLTSAAILNDLYDVKETPFDIVKLQHTIDDWTEQAYSKYELPQRTRSSEKYAKKIPDDYLTTTMPTNFVTETDNYYDLYDHEGSSSNHHAVTDKSDEEYRPPRKEYNTIERTKNKYGSGKNEEQEEIQKLHIYTAASSFRGTTTRATSTTTTTTPPPWEKIQTSISPLTKEKVYVVTSKPWRDTRNATKDWYNADSFESKKTAETPDKEVPFKSPRFIQRPSFGFTSGGKVESAKSDSSYGYSRSWYQSINELETKNNRTAVPEELRQKVTTSSDEITDSSNRHRYK